MDNYLSQTIMQAIEIMDKKAWPRARFEGMTAIMPRASRCALKASASKAVSAIRISAGEADI